VIDGAVDEGSKDSKGGLMKEVADEILVELLMQGVSESL
jgi:hypothetical protein